MNATQALDSMMKGDIVQDTEYYYTYSLVSEDDKQHLGNNENIYKCRKCEGDFISFNNFLNINAEFIIYKDNQ
ncbi:MAG: hypothetical protein LHW59_05385 [Candidatus Cloacimonetes bacterium]|nr:hypothetical protein [Candidatus Cloacimonadota bacterium]